MQVRFAIALLAVTLVVVAWLATRHAREEPGPAALVLETASRQDVEAWAAGDLQAALDESGRVEATEPDTGHHEEPEAKPDIRSGSNTLIERVTLRARFSAPDSGDVQVGSVLVELVDADGRRRSVETHRESQVVFSGLPLGRYTARARAEGFRHREQVFDLTNLRYAERHEGAAGSEPTVDERLVLWPEGWIAVIVRVPDGRVFPELAAEFGLSPTNLFVDAFDARARLDAPAPDAWDGEADDSLAVFRKPQAYGGLEGQGSVVGALQLFESPPLWVGLNVHGVPLGWELLRPGQDEIVFRLDHLALASGLARLTLRVVDGDHRPTSDARFTLKADTSAHRRRDLQEMPVASDGRATVDRLVPSTYEIYVVSGNAMFQDRITLAPGESRDLGDIELAASAGVSVRIIDTQGQPRAGWIEVGPYRPQNPTSELYPPNLHRSTERDGTLILPMPNRPSIVRATLFSNPNGPPRSRKTVQSPNVLLDPSHPPAETLTLVVHDRFEVGFDATSPSAAAIDVIDELDLVVATTQLGRGSQRKIRVVPGHYRARMLDAERQTICEVPLDVTDAPLQVRLP